MNKKIPKFPKKAKLVTFGGFYKIIPIERFVAQISVPFMTKIKVMASEFVLDDVVTHTLIFNFDRVTGGYAEYKQVDYIKLKQHEPQN